MTQSKRSNQTISSGMVMQLQWQGEKAIAELARLTAILEDRQALLAQIIHWANEHPAIAMNIRAHDLYPLADRLIAYLKPLG